MDWHGTPVINAQISLNIVEIIKRCMPNRKPTYLVDEFHNDQLEDIPKGMHLINATA